MKTVSACVLSLVLQCRCKLCAHVHSLARSPHHSQRLRHGVARARIWSQVITRRPGTSATQPLTVMWGQPHVYTFARGPHTSQLGIASRVARACMCLQVITRRRGVDARTCNQRQSRECHFRLTIDSALLMLGLLRAFENWRTKKLHSFNIFLFAPQ